MAKEKLAEEFEALEIKSKEANRFILDIADLLRMDVDSVGFDGIKFTIDDFEMAIKELPKLKQDDLVQELQNAKNYFELALDRADPTMAIKSGLKSVSGALANER